MEKYMEKVKSLQMDWMKSERQKKEKENGKIKKG